MVSLIQTALELGLICSVTVLALFLSYSMLNVCDLSTDGCFTLGATVGAAVAIAGHPYLAIPAAMLAGVTSGFVTAFLQTTILYIGLLTYTQHPLLAVGICLSANEVPRIAQMYGLDTSVRVNMMSVSHTVSMGAKAVGMIKAKA